MAAEQPDLAGSIDPARLQPDFAVVWRGFDQEQVLGHLRKARSHVASLESRLGRALHELAEARRELGRVRQEHAQARLELHEARRELYKVRRERDSATAAGRDSIEMVSEHVMDLVRGFDGDVERGRKKAQLEASSVLAEARAEAAKVRIAAQNDEKAARVEAERLLRQARQEAERSLREARVEAERLLGEARVEADSVRAELAPLRQWTLSQAQAIRERMRISILELEKIMHNGSDGDRMIVLEDIEEQDLPPVA